MSDRSNPKVLRIGITLPAQPKASSDQVFSQNLWGSGIVQNAAFLARVLGKIPGVKVFAVNNYPLAKHLGIEYTEKGPGYLRMIVEVCAKLGPIEARAFRATGGLLIHHAVGNTLAMAMEHVSGGFEATADVAHNDYDAVWCLPHIYQMNHSMFQLVHNCPVDKVPMIWGPDFLPQGWGYVPGQAVAPTVVTFEPSVSVVKTPHIPILAAEVAYRTGQANGRPMFGELKVMGHKEKAETSEAFRSFLGALEVRDVTTCEPRQPTATVFASTNVRAVVAHNWWNELNYSYNEILYGGYPLVHNSQMVEAGYRYDGFDAKAAGDLLYQALEQHDEILPNYQEAAARFLLQLHPDTVRPMYAQLLKARVPGWGV